MIRSDSASASRRGGTGRDGGSFAPPRLQALLSPCPPRVSPRSSPLPFSKVFLPFRPVRGRPSPRQSFPGAPRLKPFSFSVCGRVAPRCPPSLPAAVCAAPGSAAARNPRERGGRARPPAAPAAREQLTRGLMASCVPCSQFAVVSSVAPNAVFLWGVFGGMGYCLLAATGKPG